MIREPSTRRIEAIATALGSPNHRFPSIHITGTNGKGSTSAMATKLLRSQGLRVGTYTSPHLSEVTERIAIDEKPVSDQQFAEALGAVAWMSRRIGVTPSWFEAVTAAAFTIFADTGIDAAVVEVGMLGRWDATNILNSTVAVITNVELDHTEFAGHTRMHIAMEKAGIVHPGTTLVLGETDPKLLPIFAAQRPRQLLQLGVDITATDRQRSPTGSTVDLATPWGIHRTVPVNLLGAHQCRNAALALAAAQCFLELPLDTPTVHQALGTVQISGRAEVLPATAPVIVVDGAHNQAAARALRETLDEYFSTAKRRVLVCAASGNRRPAEFLNGIGAADFDLVIGTEVASPRSAPPESIAAAARRSGVAAMAHPDIAAALHSAVTSAGVDGLVIVAGSLYLVAAAREAAAGLASAHKGE
ncbi:bifunctional folylpolyglutamate synthase/dihydrofolate synthase [Mycolicibacterium chlorophenolicum]|nr:Mur ligase family protein [Mycolicibacterium chlorophenolicum]